MGIPNRSVFTLSSNQIKGLAAILMVVDHVGVVFFPQTQLLRYLGRLSFPLFCWLIAQGEQRTRYVYRYGLRLLVFGLISQPIYAALFETWQLNVLFTLLVGLVALRVGRELPQVKLLVWMLGVLVATAISMDGGGYGVVIVLLMAHPLTLRWWAVWIVMHGLLAASEQIRLMQLWAIPAPLLVLLVAGANRAASKEYPLSKHAAGDRPSKPRPKARWFYWFYPGHLLALWLIRLVV